MKRFPKRLILAIRSPTLPIRFPRNADGMRNLFLAARTGMFVAMYASPELRNADISAGSTRPADLLVLDVEVAAERLLIELDAMPTEAWAAAVPMSADPDALQVPAPMLAMFRLAEVELHHVDLAGGASFGQAPADNLRALLEVCDMRLRERTPPFLLRVDGATESWSYGSGDEPVITGAASDAVAWLTGRRDGAALTVTGASGLPVLPDY